MAKKKLLPKLRFPKFKNEVGWEEMVLGEVTYPLSERNHEGKKYPIYSISNVSGFIPQSEQFEGVDSHDRGYDVTLYKIVQKNTFAYNPARINVGSIGYSGDLNNILISSLYVCFKTRKDLLDSFLLHYLKSASFAESVKRSVEGGIRSYLFYENFAKITIHVPSPTEQQRIADCLSSLDELVTAENQKLEALQLHKKGLMQQLFPAEGEKVPKLRFKEFKDSGEWVEKRLEDVCSRIMDGTHFSPKSKTGPFMYLTSKNIRNGRIDLSNVSYISEKEHMEIFSKCPVQKDDALLTKDGANTGNCTLNTLDFEFSLLSSVAVIRGKPELIDQHFVYHLLSSDRIQKLISSSMSGQAITRITLQKIGSYLLLIPAIKEQQKIASCLSSLGDSITQQNQKVESLKEHKKGLLQQLFPNVNDMTNG